jgi:VanZ family protein
MAGMATGSHHTFRRVAVWLLVLTVLFIVYASLYPFQFDLDRLRAASTGGWLRSFDWRKPPRSDLIANLLFYLPFGALVTYLAPRRLGRTRRFLVAVSTGTTLSFCIECAQFATNVRVPALTDVAVNALSTAMASILVLHARSLGLRPALPELRAHRPDPIALLLVLLWLAFHAAPFMPTARFIRFFHEPALLLDHPVILTATAGYFAGYIILAAALRNLLSPTSFWPVFGATALVSVLARIFMRGQHLELSEVAGLLLAVPVIWDLSRIREHRAAWRALAFAGGALAVFIVTPLDYSASGATFSTFPQLPLAHRTIAHEPGWLEIVFLYAGCVWLADEAGIPLRRIVPWLLGVALLLELLHAWHPQRSANLLGPAAIMVGAFAVWARRALLDRHPQTVSVKSQRPRSITRQSSR